MFTYNNAGLQFIELNLAGTGPTVEDYDAFTEAGSPAQPVRLRVNVQSSATVGGINAPALSIKSFHPKSRVEVNIDGKVYGYGGDGGIRNPGSVRGGQAGGAAISADTYDEFIVNVASGAELRGGGGGGGVGQYRETPACGGGGGGGGQGYGTATGGLGDAVTNPGTAGGNGSVAGPGSGGAGGSGGGVSGGGGGSGGAWGAAGISGLNGTGGSEVLPSGSGGSAGKAVSISGGGTTTLNNSGTVSGTVD